MTARVRNFTVMSGCLPDTHGFQLMQSPDVWEPTVREECFSTDLTKKVFREICAMRERREPWELPNVVVNLRTGSRIAEDDVPIIASWGDQLAGVQITQAMLRKMVSSLLDCHARRELDPKFL